MDRIRKTFMGLTFRFFEVETKFGWGVSSTVTTSHSSADWLSSCKWDISFLKAKSKGLVSVGPTDFKSLNNPTSSPCLIMEVGVGVWSTEKKLHEWKL